MFKKRIYFASPLGFSEIDRMFTYPALIAVIQKEGYEVIDPFQLTPKDITERPSQFPPGQMRHEAYTEVNRLIGFNNATAIARCDGLFAILNGIVDSGVAGEIGFASAFKKKVLGFRDDFRLAGDNEGAVINLQVEYFINASGGRIIRSFEEIPSALREVFG
jgi:nucleoside 2-deoxyribosyltransferase